MIERLNNWLHRDCDEEILRLNDALNVCAFELKECISKGSDAVLKRSETFVKMSEELEASKKYAEDSKKIIDQLNAQVHEQKGILDYTLFEKQKEIDALKEELEAAKAAKLSAEMAHVDIDSEMKFIMQPQPKQNHDLPYFSDASFDTGKNHTRNKKGKK